MVNKGKNSQAEQLLRQATENNPRYAQAFVNLGLVLASRIPLSGGRTGPAECGKHQARQSPRHSACWRWYFPRRNRGSEAVPYFRKVIALDPKAPGAHINLGITLADQFNLEGALEEFSEAIRLDPNAAAAHYNKGRVLLDLRRDSDAKPELETATRLDPDLPSPGTYSV